MLININYYYYYSRFINKNAHRSQRLNCIHLTILKNIQKHANGTYIKDTKNLQTQDSFIQTNKKKNKTKQKQKQKTKNIIINKPTAHQAMNELIHKTKLLKLLHSTA